MELAAANVAVARPEYVTVTDLMSTYNVSRSTIYRRVKDGTLTAYKLGSRTIRFDAAEVARSFRL
jgi:excisionase family DNA binding protein